MLLIDDLLFGGLRFVFDKIATLVDQEMNDESRLHQTLMEAQMRFEMGEIGAEELAGIERTVLDRLREIRAGRDADAPALTDEGVRISSVEIAGPDTDVDVEMPAIDIEAPTPASARRTKSGTTRPARASRASRASGASGARQKRPDSTKPQPTARRRARR
jgi:hypothetical protein